MPITPTYPGVYIEEISSGVRTITGVATSITAFLGRAMKAPLNQPIRCLSFADFTRNFGPPHPNSDLAASVRQFFDNGGTECYVVRLARNATRASVTLQNYAGPPQDVLVATAKAEGAWANTVRLEVDYDTPNPDESFNLRVIQEEAGSVVQRESFANLSMNPSSPRFAPSFVTQSSQIIDLAAAAAMGDPTNPGAFINNFANSFAGFSQGRRPLGANAAAVQATLDGLIHPAAPATPQSRFEISVNDSAYVVVDLGTWVVPGSIAAIQTQLADRINGALAALSPIQTVNVTLQNVANVGRLVTIESTSGDTSSVRVRRASSNDLAAALMLGVDQGGVEPVRWSNFRPAVTGTVTRIGSGLGFPNGVDQLNPMAALLQNAITSITIDGTPVDLSTAPYDLETVGAANRWYENAPLPNSPHGDNDGVREKLRIIANAITNHPTLAYRAEVHRYSLVILATDGTINQQPATIQTGVAGFDNALVRNVRQYTLGTGGTSAFSTNGVAGLDGDAPQFADYVGNPVDQTGFHALDPVDLFNLMVLPADHELAEATRVSLWGPASNYCRQRRAFLIIDAPASWTQNQRPAVVNDTARVGDLRAPLVKDHSAVFYPRIKYNANGLIKRAGAGGVIAGLMARTDASRGVWKAPAGTEATLNSVVGLEVKLTDPENGVLNKIGVNCLRDFPGGLRVNWGARTMDGSDDFSSEWKYIPIRRLALFLEESLFRGTKWVVFEPNDEPLWAKIRLNIGAFMMRLFRQGAFQGSTPEQAFFVKCDAETTTQADRNLGIVNIEVGFAPLKPAEFVIIKIQQIAGELQT